MTQNTRIALIPAYKPEPLLIDFLHNVRETGMEAVIVDDGGGSDYADLFCQAAGFAVVPAHPENRSKGRAIKTRLEYIGKNFKAPYTIVTMDADDQHRVSDACQVCEAAERRPDSLILGSRGLRENVPLRNRLGNTITRYVYSLLTGLHVHDTQTGLRAFNDRLLSSLSGIPGERYEYEMNVLLELARSKRPIEEIRISTVYLDNNAGSHFDTMKDSCRIYREILKFSASSFAGFLVDYGLYSLLTVLTGSLAVSNITARIVSAGMNYTINSRLVFRSENTWKSAVRYFALAAAILAGNTLVLGLLVEQLGLNWYGAKLTTEMFFFIISWLVQRFFIFAGKGATRHEVS